VIFQAADSKFEAAFQELGDRSPAVVFENINVEQAVKETAFSTGIYINSGQVCMVNYLINL
jgi:aldehyde dehydrogenase (NAD+)